MQKVHRPQDKWRDVVFGGTALLVVLADQLTKWWITKWWETANPPDGILWNAGFFRIVHVFNTGAAFGIFQDHTPIIIIVVFIEIIIILLIVFFLHNRLSFLDSMLMRLSIGLIMGGAIGNQIDRLRLGYVTDFIDFKVWPAFNIADSSAVVGSIIIAFCLIFLTKTARHQE
jgi:signal peptidase II